MAAAKMIWRDRGGCHGHHLARVGEAGATERKVNSIRCQFSNGGHRLSCPEGDDAALRIVRRNADGHPVARDHLDAESPHSSAQLRENFVAGVDLHTIQATAVHRDDGALHINQVVFAHSSPLSRRSSSRGGQPMDCVISWRNRQILYRSLHLPRQIGVIVAG